MIVYDCVKYILSVFIIHPDRSGRLTELIVIAGLSCLFYYWNKFSLLTIQTILV